MAYQPGLSPIRNNRPGLSFYGVRLAALIENDGPPVPAVALDRRGTIRLLCRA
jgi:hypothetical protein